MEHYTAVVYATGAQTDKSLGIPGEDLPGSWAATEFVAWYNGHPDYRDLEFDLSAERAVVIGNGNVAADVTRILTRSPDELARTDVADHALEALRESRIEEVVVLGRRGPAQAAFTSAELRELGRMDGVDMRVDPPTSSSTPSSREWLDEEGTFTARKNVELLREFAAREPGAARRAASTCASCARRSRSAARAGSRRSTSRRNEIVRDDDGTLRARPRRTSRSRRSSAGSCCARSATARSRCPTCRSTSAATSCRTIDGRVLDARRRAAARRLRRRLDQARADRDPRHQQARRRGDGRAAWPRTSAPAPCRSRRARPERSTRCSPSASRTSSPPTAGARSTAASSSAAAPSSARGSSSRRATSCSPPRVRSIQASRSTPSTRPPSRRYASGSRRASTCSTATGATSSPSAAARTPSSRSHSWEEYAAWHLGLTDGATDETKARYAFVYGDFRRVHRTGLIACVYRAAEWRHKDVELAAHDLLQLLDKVSG